MQITTQYKTWNKNRQERKKEIEECSVH